MILDFLSNSQRYEPMHPLLAQALEWLRAADFEALPIGKTVIDGERLFALTQDYETKPLAEARWEAHRRYWDVQYVARGAERIGYAPLATMQPLDPYDGAKDIAWFAGRGDFVTMRQGMFCVLGPHDVHAPGIALDLPAPVRKVVLKVEM